MAIKWKLSGFKDWRGAPLMGGKHGTSYLPEEDSFLLFCLQRYKYGSWENFRVAIRKQWQFR